MASIYELKPAFQKSLRPAVRALARLGVTPNQVTVFALVLSLATGTVIALQPASRWPLWLVPVVLFVRMALNAIDGMLAREYDMPSKLGALLNEVGDVVSDAAIYLPFALIPGLSAPLVVVVVVLAVVSEATGIAAIGIGASRRYDGPMGKSDRAFVFGLVALAMAFGYRRFVLLNGLLAVVVLLLVLTITHRARRALKESEGEG
jgi:CDP-diacylglycerol--glycerol-3-phosphate 3-phosphatidyltransferase